MRILLFLATNLAVILVASVTLRLLGVDSYLSQYGIQYGPLLAFAAVFGFAGAFISLLMSKPMAKWSTRAKVIDSPRTPAERWLVETVADLGRTCRYRHAGSGHFPGLTIQCLCHRMEQE